MYLPFPMDHPYIMSELLDTVDPLQVRFCQKDPKILQNPNLRFVLCSNGHIYMVEISENFVYELYKCCLLSQFEGSVLSQHLVSEYFFFILLY